MIEDVAKNSTPPQTMKVLDVSITHIRRSSRCWVSRAAMMDGQYGWFVSVSRLEEDDVVDEDKMPVEVRRIMEWAVDNDCEYVLIDQDGTPYEQFEKFEW